MIIQFILILLSVFILFYFLANRNSMQVRAYKKIALILLVCVMIVFILKPDSLNTIADWVGVGRGADLLLYTLFIAFILFCINVYMKFKEQQDKVYRLAREIALIEARDENDIK